MESNINQVIAPQLVYVGYDFEIEYSDNVTLLNFPQLALVGDDFQIHHDEDISYEKSCSEGNENQPIFLDCNGSAIAGINYASYGTPDNFNSSQCSDGFDINVTCHADNSMSLVADTCVGQENCTFTASNSFFGGDPCPGTPKYMNVQYTCLDPTPPTTPVWDFSSLTEVLGRFKVTGHTPANLSFPSLRFVDNSFKISEVVNVETIDFPSLEVVFGSFTIGSCEPTGDDGPYCIFQEEIWYFLTGMNFGGLKYVADMSDSGDLADAFTLIFHAPQLENIIFPVLERAIVDDFWVFVSAPLTNLSFPLFGGNVDTWSPNSFGIAVEPYSPVGNASIANAFPLYMPNLDCTVNASVVSPPIFCGDAIGDDQCSHLFDSRTCPDAGTIYAEIFSYYTDSRSDWVNSTLSVFDDIEEDYPGFLEHADDEVFELFQNWTEYTAGFGQ
jgi:hypothetical protein